MFLRILGIANVTLMGVMVALMSANISSMHKAHVEIVTDLRSVAGDIELPEPNPAMESLFLELGKTKLAAQKATRSKELLLNRLDNVIAIVAVAEIERSRAKKEAAAQKIKQAKPLIWKLGESIATEKKELHALMKPLDKCTAKLKTGSGDCGIYKELVQKLGAVRERVRNG